MILQANSPEIAMHVLSVNNCGDDFFAEVKTEVTVLFQKDSFIPMHILKTLFWYTFLQFCSDVTFEHFFRLKLVYF